ncbi:MAG: ABC transporter ATP-binding protein [Gammaproteobacteria bacterium]
MNDVTLNIHKGECLGLIGESGSGKSTLGRVVVQLITTYTGRIFFDNVDLSALSSRQLQRYRPRLQMVFQDPAESLNPRFTIEDIIGEPLRLLRIGTLEERRVRITSMLKQVGLTVGMLKDRPGQYSGGQRQRIAIARALVTEPELMVLDEPTSGLDVSMQARILNLLHDLQAKLGLTYLFITHDVGAVSYLANRVAVLYHGSLVELASTQYLINNPHHPYTVALLDALPRFVRGSRKSMSGAPFTKHSEGMTLEGKQHLMPQNSAGCPYVPHCSRCQERCLNERPDFRMLNEHAGVACHYPVDSPA